MTEVPEHLRKRAEEARKKAEAKAAGGDAAPAAAPEPPPARPAVTYQQIAASDSPLDLPDLDVIEQHTHEPAHIRENVRLPCPDRKHHLQKNAAREVSAPRRGKFLSPGQSRRM